MTLLGILQGIEVALRPFLRQDTLTQRDSAWALRQAQRDIAEERAWHWLLLRQAQRGSVWALRPFLRQDKVTQRGKGEGVLQARRVIHSLSSPKAPAHPLTLCPLRHSTGTGPVSAELMTARGHRTNRRPDRDIPYAYDHLAHETFLRAYWF